MAFCKQCGAVVEDDARFCEKCGTPIKKNDGGSSTVMMQSESNVRRQTYEGEVRKCPNCGDPIDAFEYVCDKCGFNFSTNRMSTSQERLSAQLSEIDAKLQEAQKKSKKGDKEWAIPFKEQKATRINTFPVANSVEEILSFMTYACGNIDMTCLASNNMNIYDKGDIQIAEAWIGKMDQMYQMAKIALSNDSRFATIEKLYMDKKKEIRFARIKKIIFNPFLLYILLVFLMMLFMKFVV